MEIEFLQTYLPRFLFVLLRTSVFMSLMPIFSSRNHPVQFKVGLAVALAAVITPVAEFQYDGGAVPFLVLREVMFGMALGLAVRFVFFAVNMAGLFMSTAMGLRAGNIFDPEFGEAGEIARLLSIVFTLMFFAVDAHHDIIYIFVKSFELVPAGQADIASITGEVMELVGRMFAMALKMAIPVIIGTMIISAVIGLMNKAVPQIHLLILSFPMYISVGLVILLLSVPVLTNLYAGYFAEASEEMHRMVLLAGQR